MAGFNQTELDNLERHELHLSILAVIIVLVMAGGVALLMYPLVFVHPDAGSKWTLRFAFIGFCILSLLFAAYLLDRQRTVRRLKQELVAELKRNLDLRHQANVDLLHTIPDLSHFQDRLSMEFRRAFTMQRTLSVLVVKLKLPRSLAGTEGEAAALGEAARVISHNLSAIDSMYLFCPGLFGVVMPDTDTAGANRVAVQLEETLRIVGDKNKFAFQTFIYNYPDQVKSAHEFEETVASLLPEKQDSLEGVPTL
jgi:GGDEF domain-containing protein